MNKIGVIITNNKRQLFHQHIINGVREVLPDTHELMVNNTPDPSMSISLDIETLAGILVLGNTLSPAELHQLQTSDKPILLVNHYDPVLSIPAVIQNYEDGILKLIDYVVKDCQRKQIVFIAGDMVQHTAIDQTGFMRHQLIIPDDYYLLGNFNPVTSANVMLDFLDRNKPFDAVIAADYLMGCAALDVMRAFDVAIPEAVSVVAFGDGPEAEAMGLTVVGSNVLDLGRRAAQQLLNQIKGIPIDTVTVLDNALIIRET